MTLEPEKQEKTYPVIEVFRSLQGEGLYAGQSHLFLRFDKCNIDCHYCDELKKSSTSWTVPAMIEAIEALVGVAPEAPFLSFTGGEPLLYPEAILSVREYFGLRLRYYLETNGNLPRPLSRVIAGMDVVAMDIKLSSISKTKNTFAANSEFLRICRSNQKEVFVKIVVGEMLDSEEWREALALIRAVDSAIPLVIQPLTLQGQSVSVQTLMCLQENASQYLRDVRVMPRLHEIFQIP